jgi:hypothetical protein
MRTLTAAVVAVIVLVSALPWEGLAFSKLGFNYGLASVRVVESPVSSTTACPSNSPREDGCAFLCPICPAPVLSTNGFPAEMSFAPPVGKESAPLCPQGPHTSTAPSQIFHPPRIG